MTPARAIAILGYHDLEELADLADQLAGKRAAGLFDADAATIRATARTPSAGRRSTTSQRTRDHVWLHIDLDVLDQDVFPATDYLMSGGLDWDELVALLTPGRAATRGSPAGRCPATTRRRTRAAATAGRSSPRWSASSADP